MVFKFVEAGPATVTRWSLDISLAFLLQVLLFQQLPGAVPTVGAILIAITITFEGIRKHQAKKIPQEQKTASPETSERELSTAQDVGQNGKV